MPSDSCSRNLVELRSSQCIYLDLYLFTKNNSYHISQGYDGVRRYLIRQSICTSTKFYFLFNFTVFTYLKDVLNLICMKYYELGIHL